MKMAKASEADLKMAIDLSNALVSLEHWQAFPLALRPDTSDPGVFDIDNPAHCREVMEYLLELVGSASLFRVVFGMAMMLDPRNKLVDPDADTIEHHPETVKARGERGVLVALLKEADGVLATLDDDADDTGEGAARLAQLRRDIAKAIGTIEPTTQQGIPA